MTLQDCLGEERVLKALAAYDEAFAEESFAGAKHHSSGPMGWGSHD